MMQDVNYLEQFFLSTEVWGILGPMGLVIIGYYLMKEDRTLGILWVVVEWVIAANYSSLISTTPGYAWHFFILLMGGLLTCVFPLWDQ